MTFRIALVVAAALAAVVPLATPAAAAPRPAGVTVDATFEETFLYSRGTVQGFVNTEGGAHELLDATGGTTGLTGYGKIYKGQEVRTVQVDFVRLGIATGPGGVLAETRTPRNSGPTGTYASSETVRWTAVRSAGCTTPTFRVWVRVGYSARWSNGVVSRWSVLGPASSTQYCRA